MRKMRKDEGMEAMRQKRGDEGRRERNGRRDEGRGKKKVKSV